MLYPQTAWLAGEFRDCNGESNGSPLAASHCEEDAGNRTGAGPSQARLFPEVGPRNIYITPAPPSPGAGGQRGKKIVRFPSSDDGDVTKQSPTSNTGVRRQKLASQLPRRSQVI